jgi:hypothetical protein
MALRVCKKKKRLYCMELARRPEITTSTLPANQLVAEEFEGREMGYLAC